MMVGMGRAEGSGCAKWSYVTGQWGEDKGAGPRGDGRDEGRWWDISRGWDRVGKTGGDEDAGVKGCGWAGAICWWEAQLMG